jgi:capsular polysaccharide biosynthesis protein
MLGLGLASVINGDEEFTSAGTLSVTNESLLADLTNASQTGGLSFETPATVRARQINELLGTDQFLRDVATDAGIEDLLVQGTIGANQLRSWTSASADGDSIVRVSAVTPNRELSFRLAESTINSFRQWVIDSDVSQSTSTVESLEQRVAEKQAALDAADQAVEDKILEQPEVALEDRSLVDQQIFERLTLNAERARDQLVEAQDALDTANLQTIQASAIVAQRLQVLDEPQVPVAPNGRLKQAALTMIVFFFLGLVLSVVSVVIAATLDRTIRVPNDITSRFGVDVLAVVPETGR